MAFEMIGEPPPLARHLGSVHRWRFAHTTDGGECDFEFMPAGRGAMGSPTPGTGRLRFTCQYCGEVAIPDTGLRTIKFALKALPRKDTVSLPTRGGDPIVIHRPDASA